MASLLGHQAPSPLHPLLTPARSAVLKSVAVLFTNLADALASSRWARVPPVLGSPRLLLPPAKILAPTSLSEPARLRLQLYHRVSGEQEATAAGSPALMVHLRALEMMTSRTDLHLSEEPSFSSSQSRAAQSFTWA